ncbi:DNA primase [Candidatus Pacearchaeota archaeon]|nr:DNA primase [Candidatus Pacearchaeota archaeon]
MAKISPVSIKYMIYATFEAEGTIEKPDVIGAIFGQTEGLLGTDLELRDLQKEGKIGRIDVETESRNGKTYGKIMIPSALDKTETTLIAASIETIERVGPSNAKIITEKIEDVRENKREYILERAKKLLEGVEEKMSKSREIVENIKTESRAGKIKDYGEEKLSSGDISGNEIIVVEGRADVVNLLRNNVENVISMNGTILPEAIKSLGKTKSITLFLDGDRGGKLIARNVISNTKVDYVAFAPDGKEVEELSGKEILMSLRKKISASEFLDIESRNNNGRFERREKREEVTDGKSVEESMGKLKEMIKEVENTKDALILDKNLEIMDKISTSRNLFSVLNDMKKRVYAIIVDKATPTIIRAAEDLDVKHIIAKNFAYSEETKVNLVSL